MASPFEQQLAGLHPDVRPLAELFLQDAAAAGLDPRIQESFRSRDRQDALYAQGRTAPGAIVTKARGGQSNHNYGVAFDVVPGALLDKPNWAPEDPAWTTLGQLAEKRGLEWGGNWKFVDKPHVQMKGANWRQMQNDPKFSHFNGDGHSHGGQAAVPAAIGDVVAPASATAAAPQPAGMSPGEFFGDILAPRQDAPFGNVVANYLQSRQQRDQQAEAENVKRQALLGSIGSPFGRG